MFNIIIAIIVIAVIQEWNSIIIQQPIFIPLCTSMQYQWRH